MTSCSGNDQFAEITSDGDVVLIVGVEMAQLRVSSTCLGYASKVFKAMFGPDWYEGQSLSKESPTEVHLPDDDANAMWTVCSLVHYRNDLIPDHLPSDSLLQLAIVIDKYDMKLAVKHAVLQWLSPRATGEMVQMGQLLAAAYLLQYSEAFMAHTRTLLLENRGPYLDLLNDELISKVLPPKICCLLEVQRSRMRLELYETWINGKSEVCECGWGKARDEDYQMLLIEHKPTEMMNLSISSIITHMEHLYSEDLKIEGKLCTSDVRGANNYHRRPEYYDTPLGRLKSMKELSGVPIELV